MTTTINTGKLEEWCQQLPDCEDFLRTFFTENGHRPIFDNTTEYALALSDYVWEHPEHNRHYDDLVLAFIEISPEPSLKYRQN